MRFPWQERKELLTADEQAQVVAAIQATEQQTSGEVRLFIEAKCRFMDAVDRAAEVFTSYRMHETKERNAVLIYVAVDDHQAAVFGDEGIHQRVGKEYWQKVVEKMIFHFRQNHLADGLCAAISELGDALHQHFPFNANTDKNELPDEIIFGATK